MEEIRQRQSCKEVVKSHQRRLKNIWQSHIDVKKAPESKFYLPGPGAYEGKSYIRDEPSFAVHKFQQTARPFNKVNMKEQTELIEYMQEKRVKDRLASVNEYCGCKFFFSS